MGKGIINNVQMITDLVLIGGRLVVLFMSFLLEVHRFVQQV